MVSKNDHTRPTLVQSLNTIGMCFDVVAICSGSNQSLWQSEEDGRRYYTGLCQEQHTASCDDLEVCQLIPYLITSLIGTRLGSF
jgi:hypothetical protein